MARALALSLSPPILPTRCPHDKLECDPGVSANDGPQGTHFTLSIQMILVLKGVFNIFGSLITQF